MFSLEIFFNVYTLIFIAFCCFLWYRSTSTFDHWKKQNIPFKKPVPIFGNITRYALLQECFHEFLDEMYYYFEGAPYFGIFQMLNPALVVRDPELAHTIMVKEFNNFYDRGLDVVFPHKKLNPLSYHLLAATGNNWRVLRRKLTPVFTSSKLRQMHDQMASGVEKLDKLLEERIENGATDQNLKDIYERLNIDLIGSCAFGIDCNSLKQNEEFKNMAHLAFKTTFLRIITNLLDKKYRLLFRLPDHRPNVVKFFKDLVLGTIEYRRKNDVKRNDLLQQLMELQNCHMDPKYAVPKTPTTDEERFDEIDIVANSFVFFMGGHETSTLTLGFCMYELALNPNVQERLRAEVDEAYQKGNQTLTPDSLKDMEYLEAVISETLRKYPPAPFLMRVCAADYQIPNSNRVIKAGTKLIFPIWSYSHDEKYFPNADEFQPERFLGANKDKIPKGVYMPYGEGPRYCIGMTFAKMELRNTVANAVLKYVFAPCAKTEIPITYMKANLLLRVKNGPYVNIRKRKT